MKTFCFSVFSICLLAGLASAQCGTTISGGTVIFQTWTLAGSPYCVVGDVMISALTIQPGVEVVVSPGVTLTVLGGLKAAGTNTQPIVFRDGGQGPWTGMRFNATPGNSVLRYCEFRGAGDGALELIDSSPTIERCSFIGNNRSSDAGGALRVIDGTSCVAIDSCVFLDNDANTNGGAIRVEMKNGFTCTLSDCEFVGNEANANKTHPSIAGGAIYFTSTTMGRLELRRCRLRGNTAFAHCSGIGCGSNAYGGAIYVSGGDVDLSNCIFAANRCRATHSGSFSTGNDFGGALYLAPGGSAVATNCVVVDNDATEPGAGAYGSGVYVAGGTAVDLVNCTIVRNTTHGVWFGGGTTSIRNSILFFNNGQGAQFAGGAAYAIDYTCVQNGGWPTSAMGCIQSNPQLSVECDPRILATSPCVDAGDPSAAYDDVCFPPSVDYFGFGGARNDMGAFGGPGACGWLDAAGWTNLGHALAGPGGAPSLVGSGVLREDYPVFVTITNAPPFSFATFVLGIAELDYSPFLGGTLVPDPLILTAPVPVDGNGRLPVCANWPEGVPAGTTFVMQAWIPDAAAPTGFVATNGVRGED